MKLFSWMHRKAKTDITSSFTGSSATGLKSSLDNQGIYATPGNNYATLKWQPQNSHYFTEFSVQNYEELTTGENDEIFPGFLTIGTLSVEPVTEPSTPTFGFPSRETNEEGIGTIKPDLNLISENLEKFLEAEMEQQTNKPTCDKTQASIITLGDEVKDDISNAAHQLYPLQGYLLGSSTEQQGPKETEEKAKTFLRCLINRKVMMKTSSVSGDPDKIAAKENKSSDCLTKKMLRKTLICSEVSVCCAVKPLPKVTKPNKIKSMFHKKIHPEISKAAEDNQGFSKYENERVLSKSKSASRKSDKIGCWATLTGGKKRTSKSCLTSPADAIANMNLDLPEKDGPGCACREHWINTDAEYFVLELNENKG